MSADATSIDGLEFLPQYAKLWESFDRNSFFRSPGHLKLISKISRSCLQFAVLHSDRRPVAALPFATLHGSAGSVINSLPFYGSCGGVVSGSPLEHAGILAEAVLAHARTTQCKAVTFVDDWRAKSFEALHDATFLTRRTNQFIDLEAIASRDPMDFYHQKTRNVVRKAVKCGVQVHRSLTRTDIDGLRSTHIQNMAAINGAAKPSEFFDALRDPDDPLGPWALYVATLDGAPCAYLLNFHCGDTVEYYMPTAKLELRTFQPLSLLIDFSIRESIKSGFKYWNFGGTWESQDSLRHFKKRWGGAETEYCYFSFILDQSVLSAGKLGIAAAYPYFFIAPFDQIVN